MRWIPGTVGALLFSVVAARPGLEERATCALTGCISSAFKQHTIATNDCSSFFFVVITPCPVTSTHSTTVTKSAKASTQTEHVERTTTHYSKTTATETVIHTDTSTTTSVDLTTFTASETLIATFTTTEYTETDTVAASTSLVIASSTAYTTSMAPLRRALQVRSKCTPKTSIATNVPSYATACASPSSSSAFSSACSCIKAKHKTSTLPASITYATHTITETQTPTVTVTRTSIINGGTIVDTISTTTTEQSTAFFLTAYETTTASVTAVVTTEYNGQVTVDATTTFTEAIATLTSTEAVVTETTFACPIQMLSGPYTDQYLQTNPRDYGYLNWTADKTEAAECWIQTQGILYCESSNPPEGGRVLVPTDAANKAALTPGWFSPADPALNDSLSYDPMYYANCQEGSDGSISCENGHNGPNNMFLAASWDTFLYFGSEQDLDDYTEVKMGFACD